MTYRDILSTDYFFDTYSKIEVMKRDFPVNHGFLHVWNVIQNAKRLAEIFNLDEQEKNLLLISASLHDIGYIQGRKEHALNGSKLAKQYLKDKLPDEDIEKVSTAIANHGGDNVESFKDKISLCLILADKLDFDHRRYRYDELHKESCVVYLSIKKVEFVPSDSGFEFKIYTSNLSLFDNYQERHFFKKLERIFENFFKATNKKINLTFTEVEPDETDNILHNACTY